jgi:hypothetical protein
MNRSKHLNLVKFHEFQETTYFAVLEFCQEGMLKNFIKKLGKRQERVAAFFWKEIVVEWSIRIVKNSFIGTSRQRFYQLFFGIKSKNIVSNSIQADFGYS